MMKIIHLRAPQNEKVSPCRETSPAGPFYAKVACALHAPFSCRKSLLLVVIDSSILDKKMIKFWEIPYYLDLPKVEHRGVEPLT
jgi:hypothetical protein